MRCKKLPLPWHHVKRGRHVRAFSKPQVLREYPTSLPLQAYPPEQSNCIQGLSRAADAETWQFLINTKYAK